MAGHSFIDIAVLEPMRSRFAAGDALLLVDTGLDTVIWSNGAGAKMIGHQQVEAAIGAETGFSPAARRQIMATPGFPAIGENRTVIVRIGREASRAVLFRASAATLPSGEAAILLAAPIADASKAAEQIVSGLSGPGEEGAWLDENGQPLASTAGFAAMAPNPAVVADLVRTVSLEHDRLVKRIVATPAGRLGVGIARLADRPARHLIVLVSENAGESAAAPATEPQPDAPRSTTTPAADDRWYFSGDGQQTSTTAEAKLASDGAVAPVRFVWRTDAEGRFSAVSPEFAHAVGATAADIIGRSFAEVARVFNLDPQGEVAGLLERRDTWSGRTVLWPIAGSDLKAPVDLAALPAYTRERVFDGFRGFGIVRRAEAATDPEAIGLSLVTVDAPRQHAASRDPFKGEPPALAGHEPKAHSEKVVRLAERRTSAGERELSQTERLAFREIGDRLKDDERRPVSANDDRAPSEPAPWDASEYDAGGLTDGDETGFAPAETAMAGLDALPEEPFTPAASETTSENAFAAETPDLFGDLDADAAESPVADINLPGAPVADLPDDDFDDRPLADDISDAWPESPTEALPADAPSPAMVAGPALLARLPLPMLVQSGDRLRYANDEFLLRTGYATLDELNDAGGLGALIAGPYPADDDAAPAQRRAVRLIAKDGGEFAAEAHLQSIPWTDGRALLLSLRPVPAPQAMAAAPIPVGDDETPETGSETVQTEAAMVAAAHSGPKPTEIPVADEALSARVAELETILDTATDGILTLDRDGAIRSVSRAAQALFGFEAADLAGKPFVSLFATESQRSARDYLASLTENGVASVLNDGREVIGREAKGGFIPLFMTIGRLPGDSGFCAVLRDITQFKRAEEELTQARRKAEAASSQKSDFLARVSHEIRTPLNAIIGFSELMLDEKFGPVGNDRYLDYLRDINKSGNHVLDLVNDLLDISKIEAGQQDLSYEAVRLNETLADAVSLMQPQANRERVIIRSSYASSLPEVVADLRSIKQIALNLLSNAVRFTNPGGQVIVSTSYESNGDVAMRVRDTGVGMTRSEIDLALKPFKQVSTLKRPRGDGTGLGLPLTKALVEANRARFVIASTPGEGTMVEVVFPATRVLAG